MRIDDPSGIIDGNERVVRPRLADAQFFYDQDRQQTLADRLPQLTQVVYHARLGTQAERSTRIQRLAASLAPATGASAADAERAALLAKTDLLTGMVGEFPELQGIMGRYLCAPRRRKRGRGQCHCRALPAPLCRRRPARLPHRTGAGPGRQAGNTGRHLGHRAAPHRRQGSVRPAPPCAGRGAHPDRRQAAAGRADAAGTGIRRVRQPAAACLHRRWRRCAGCCGLRPDGQGRQQGRCILRPSTKRYRCGQGRQGRQTQGRRTAALHRRRGRAVGLHRRPAAQLPARPRLWRRRHRGRPGHRSGKAGPAGGASGRTGRLPPAARLCLADRRQQAHRQHPAQVGRGRRQ